MKDALQQMYFDRGVISAAAVVWRSHGDRVIVQDLLKEFNVHDTAKFCPEHDLQPLRLNVLSSLPLGEDAEYAEIRCCLVSPSGEVICDLNHADEESESISYCYGVYGLEHNGSRRLLVSKLYGVEEAHDKAKVLTDQNTLIKEARKHMETEA